MGQSISLPRSGFSYDQLSEICHFELEGMAIGLDVPRCLATVAYPIVLGHAPASGAVRLSRRTS